LLGVFQILPEEPKDKSNSRGEFKFPQLRRPAVEFIEENGGGAGVRLRKSHRARQIDKKP
jgi:hypothetical protein